MLHITPKDISVGQLHQYLLGSVGPRPIALASTIDEDGTPNLSPYSFFNVFSANPPIAIFSPARRVRDNTSKHTLENVKVNKEVVINVVSYDMVQQTSLSSTEYAAGVNEFLKAGFTPLESEKVRPYRVKESPVQLECKVIDITALGKEGGAGNLVICEIIMLHINDRILDDDGAIDPHKLDLVGRLGGNWYCRSSFDALFEVEKPLRNLGIGVDNIPENIRYSSILSGNDLGILGNVEALPTHLEVDTFRQKNQHIPEIFAFNEQDKKAREALHQRAKTLLKEGHVKDAWKTLMIDKIN